MPDWGDCGRDYRHSFLERDRHGNLRNVIPRSNSHGKKSDRQLLREYEERETLHDAQVAALQSQLAQAKQDIWRFGDIDQQYQRLVQIHNRCGHGHAQTEQQISNLHAQLEGERSEARRFEDMLYDEKAKTKQLEKDIKKLDERIRLLKRTSGDYEVYRNKYDDKKLELEICRADLEGCRKDHAQKVSEVELLRHKLREKDQKIFEKGETIRSLNKALDSADSAILLKNRTVRDLKDFLRSKGYYVD